MENCIFKVSGKAACKDEMAISNLCIWPHPAKMVAKMMVSLSDRRGSNAEDFKAFDSKRLLVSSMRKIHMPGKPAMGCEAEGSQTTTAALSDSPRGAVGARANVPLQKQRPLLGQKVAV